jgi:iron(II)-dependent oxidoreductase
MTTDIRGDRLTDIEIRRRLAADLTLYRRRTRQLIDPLSYDDIHRQQSEIMSPLVWDVGHVGNFEELWLLRELDGRAPHDPVYDQMYNPFDNPRWTRGDLPLLDRDDAVEYSDEVRGDALAILERIDLDPDDPLLRDGYVFKMVIQHEAQHHETILQALDLRENLDPYSVAGFAPSRHLTGLDDSEQILIPGGPFLAGTGERTKSYDNERPQHWVDVSTFGIDRFPVSNRRFAEFVAGGGYDRRELWSAEGWNWRTNEGVEAPQGWIPQIGGGWLIRRFGHVFDLDMTEPVQHVSYHEAEAFARYAGGRLPTEFEWEKVATWGPEATTPRVYPWGSETPNSNLANVGQSRWGPASLGTYPLGASAFGVDQLLGDVYEWTSSPFVGYPGFEPFPYPEYSEVFFDDTEYRVLRGASWATSTAVSRSTFRNWDYRVRRQIFSGIRLAWNI